MPIFSGWHNYHTWFINIALKNLEMNKGDSNAQDWLLIFSGQHNNSSWFTNIAPKMPKCPHPNLVPNICDPFLVSDIITPPESPILHLKMSKFPYPILVPNICDPFLVDNRITPPNSPILHPKCPHQILVCNICSPFLVGNLVTPPQSQIMQQKSPHAHFWIYCSPFATHIFRWQHNCLPWFADIASEISTNLLLNWVPNICYRFSITHFPIPLKLSKFMESHPLSPNSVAQAPGMIQLNDLIREFQLYFELEVVVPCGSGTMSG